MGPEGPISRCSSLVRVPVALVGSRKISPIFLRHGVHALAFAFAIIHMSSEMAKEIARIVDDGALFLRHHRMRLSFHDFTPPL